MSGLPAPSLALFAWLLLAAAGAAAATPELPPPPDARVSWVARNMRYHGLPMAVRHFTTRDGLEDVLAFYEREWDDGTRERPGYLVSDLAPPWTTISRIEDGHMLMVQVQAAGDGGAFGYLSVSRLPKDGKAPKLGRDFPVMGGSRIVNEVISEDPGQTGRTLMLANRHDLGTNVSFYRSHYTDKGWAIDMDRAVGGNMHVLALRKGRERVDLVLAELKRGVTRVIANEVRHDLL